MRIFNTCVYGLHSSVIRSGWPMATEIPEIPEVLGYTGKDIERAQKLGNATPGSGHDVFLSGIIVQADFEAPGYWWPQLQRYHFTEFVSSQSKMHRLTKFDLKKQCPGVDDRIVAVTKEYIENYNKNPTNENFEDMLRNSPQGLELTAGLSLSYRQIKTMYLQRHNHRLKMWRVVFKEWTDTLPHFKELCLKGED